jgi:hypothetical protein
MVVEDFGSGNTQTRRLFTSANVIRDSYITNNNPNRFSEPPVESQARVSSGSLSMVTVATPIGYTRGVFDSVDPAVDCSIVQARDNVITGARHIARCTLPRLKRTGQSHRSSS